MKTVIAKWGNSNAIRLPKAILDALGLRENDPVQIGIKGRSIVIEKPYPATLRELFKDYGGERFFEEWDTGAPRGAEILEDEEW